MKKYLIPSLILVTSLLSVKSTTAASINFQDLIDDGTLPLFSVVDDQFSSEGVVFSIEDIQSSTFNGPITDHFGTIQTSGMFNTFNYNKPIIADFTVPVDHVTFSSIENSPLTAIAYNTSGIEINNVSISDGTFSGEITTFENIDYISFFNNSGTGYNGRSDLTIISRLSFDHTPQAVPESSLIHLIVISLFFIVCTRKKCLLHKG